MSDLFYKGYTIAFQEVPNETSLVINVSGCPHHCAGCHSTYLWDNEEAHSLNNDLLNLIDQYKSMISCVCFMGGDQDIVTLSCYLQKIKQNYGLKTAIYSGCDNIDIFRPCENNIDYLKIGRYRMDLGGLDKPLTNQKMFQLHHVLNDTYYEDITTTFQKKVY